jgi:CSLREA domain-containing protein
MITLQAHARRRFRLPIFALLCLAANTAGGTTITVNSNADTVANDGQCTLREAINSANTNAASGAMSGECAAGQASTVDIIQFSIPGTGVHTISPASTLIVTQAVKIDGYTQPGASVNTLPVGNNAVLLIEIASGNLDGVIQLNGVFSGDSSGSTIRGLVIDQSTGRGIFVGNGFTNGSNNDTIIGNFLGVDPTGMTASATSSQIVTESSTGLVIGGPSPADRNVISASNQDPLFINLTASSVIQGNYIGVNAAGTASLGAEDGIVIIQSSNNNKIGGTAPGEGNVIYGSFHAISIANSDNTTIQGNFIGTDVTGSIGLGPAFGISIESSSGTLIGGADAGAGNTISGNQTGIHVGNLTPETIIQGNRIGTDPTGTVPVINTGDGIQLTDGNPSVGSVIGGTNPGEANTIAFSCGQGVDFNQSTTDWSILGNSIYASSGLGISFNPRSGPTANDPGDADTGPNNLQNYPVITSAPVSGGNATITGTLNSIANTQYRLEFFSNVECSRSGFGEGHSFIGTTNVTTNSGGDASFGPLGFAAPGGETAITATATDPNGNTSEFSMCVGGIGRIFANGFEPSCGN